jgi:hypothetical protein
MEGGAMVPIRILLVEDMLRLARDLARDLEEVGSFEVHTASSMAAGLLTLARLRPDILIVYPYAGRGTPEEWSCTVERFRANRPLSLLVLSGAHPERETEVLGGLADLGMVPRHAGSEQILALLERWFETGENLLQAA